MSAVRLTTDRAYLTFLSKSDYGDILEMFRDNEAFEYIPHLRNQNKKYYTDYLDDKMKVVADGRGYYWVARLQEGNKLLGCINVTPVSTVDPRVQIGWIIRRQYWKQGYAKELANEVFRYSADDLAIQEIYGFFDKRNIASQRIFDQMPFDFVGEEDEDDVQVYKYCSNIL